MDEWKLYIDAHIHSIYTREYGITSDYWNEGGIGLRIFQLPPDYEKSSKLLRPVGIRSLPIVDGKILYIIMRDDIHASISSVITIYAYIDVVTTLYSW
jgi:hypothetical protein